MKIQGIVDRIEGDYCVVELPDKEKIDIPKKYILEVKQHDIIDITFTINREVTQNRKKEISDLFDSLKNKS